MKYIQMLDTFLQDTRRVYPFIGILSLLVWIGVLALDVPTLISRFAVDDTFYYLKIARNIALGNGVTFDGIHRTNGFQPLFQLVLVPVFWLSSDPISGLYFVKTLEVILLVITSILLFRFTLRMSGNSTAAWFALTLFYVPGPGGLPFNKDLMIGMESGINALMNLLLLNTLLDVWNVREVARRHYIFYGVVIGFAFLARLDSIFMILSIAMLHFFELYKSNDRATLLANLSLACAVSAVIAGTYLSWNLIMFGHIEPISGRVLSWNSNQISRQLLGLGISHWLENVFWFLTKGNVVAILVIAGGGLPVFVYALNRYISRGTRYRPMFVSRHLPVLMCMWVASVLKVTYYSTAVQYPYNARFWYYILESIIYASCGGILISFFLQMIKVVNSRQWAFYITLLVMTAGSIFIFNSKPLQEWEYISYHELDTISSLTDSQAVIGVEDAGLIGYFLPNTVINLDGLVNDEEFFKYLREERLDEYVLKEDIDFLTNLLEPGDDDRFTRVLGPEYLQLIYRSDLHLEGNDQVYKLYRVIK